MDSDDFSLGENGRRRPSFSSLLLRTISVNFAIVWIPGVLALLYLIQLQLNWLEIHLWVHKPKDGFFSTLRFVCFLLSLACIGDLQQPHFLLSIRFQAIHIALSTGESLVVRIIFMSHIWNPLFSVMKKASIFLRLPRSLSYQYCIYYSKHLNIFFSR